MKKKLIIYTSELSRKWIDRMVDNGVDVLGLHCVGGEKAHEYLANDVDNFFCKNEFRELVDYAKSRGLEIEYSLHAMSYLLPRSLFETHPEFFRCNESGVRTSECNLCASDEQALDIVAENAVKLANNLYGSNDNYYFWLDDCNGKYCNCDKCRHLSPSDQTLLITNAILKRLRKHNPAAKLAYLGYYQSEQVPQKIRPENGVFLEYAPFTRDMNKSAQAVPEETKENMRKLLQYFGQENSWVLEYFYDNSYFSKWDYKKLVRFVPDNDTIRSDVAYYADLGFENVSSFACMLGKEYEDLYGEPDVSAFKK